MKNLVSRGGGVFKGGFSVFVVLGSNVANFVKQVIVFVVVLFFLITSEAGGVMEQALEMVPLSEVTRQKCAAVLDRTISTVLLSSGKLMIFQVPVFLIPTIPSLRTRQGIITVVLEVFLLC